MNEQIEELAVIAEKFKKDEISYRERMHNRYCTGDEEEEIFREKFAELIVRHCADIANSVGEHGYIASKEMLEHFGIE